MDYVSSGQKIKLRASTVNEVARHINNVPTISSGKPLGGGGGSSVVADNTPDIFKIHFNSVGGIYITGGNVYYGGNFIQFQNNVRIITANTIPSHFVNDASVDNVLFHYITVNCQLISGIYQIVYSWYESFGFIADNVADAYNQTIAKSTWRYNSETQLYDAVKIEQYIYPTNIVINNRWT